MVFVQKKRGESHKDIKQTFFNTQKLFRILVAVGSMIIHWFEAISFSSWLKLDLTWNTKAAFLLTWHWMSQIRENRNKRGYCEDQLVVMFTTRAQLRRSSIYCPADSQCLIPNLEFYPKSWSWKRQNYHYFPAAPLHNHANFYFTILYLDILYFQHSITILQKCKVKQVF